MSEPDSLAEQEHEDAAIDAAMDDVMLSIRRILDQDTVSPMSGEPQNSNEVDLSTASRLAHDISADPALLAKVESHLRPEGSMPSELTQTLERLMVPLLWEWLSLNLPTIVDRIVREEVLGKSTTTSNTGNTDSDVMGNEKK